MKKKVCLALMISILLGGAAFALDPLGPPIAAEQSSVGLEYGQVTFDQVDSTWLGGNQDMKADVSKFLIRGELAIPDDYYWSVFVQAGPAWGSLKNAPACSWPSLLDDGVGFAVSGGAKVTFWETPRIDWGAIAQLGYTRIGLDDETGQIGRVVSTVGGNFSTCFVEIAAGPNIYLTENQRLSAFGGPFVGFQKTDLDIDVDTYGYRYSADGDDSGFLFGGYAGLKGDISQRFSLYGEYQLANYANGFFLGGLYRFR